MAFKYFLPALLWAALIFLAISLPGSYFPKTELPRIPHPDKIIHFGMFLVFGVLLSYGFFQQFHLWYLTKYYALITVMIGLVYGATTEILQHFVFIDRNGNVYDFLANLFGTIFGVLLFKIISRLFLRREVVNS